MGEGALPAQGELSADASKRMSDDQNGEAGTAKGMSTAAVPAGAFPASQRSGADNGNETPLSPQHSCLSVAGRQRERSDSYGQAILKGEKKHKVIFVDQLNQGSSIHEVREVKSFKNSGNGCKCTVMCSRSWPGADP